MLKRIWDEGNSQKSIVVQNAKMPSLKSLHTTISTAFSMLRFSDLAIRRTVCHCCGSSWLVRLRRSELGVRCLSCGASTVHMALARVIQSRVPSLQTARAHEFSSRGPLVAFLSRHAGTLSLSEYFDGVDPGKEVGGVRCEDVERLTFDAGQFDLITSSDVFEHVADDRRGFSEVLRVLGRGGQFIFTVPIRLDRTSTEERSLRADDGTITHLLPPEYHGDRLRGSSRVLSFRDYALDLEARLLHVGFVRVEIIAPDANQYWGHGRAVIVANRA